LKLFVAAQFLAVYCIIKVHILYLLNMPQLRLVMGALYPTRCALQSLHADSISNSSNGVQEA
jgi:hypothetical protein